MGGFIEQLRLAEKAAEDIYFTKVNRELIDALHKPLQTEKNTCQPPDQFNASTQEEKQCQ